MDPVSAFGATVGAFQILDYSIKIATTASRLIESRSGVPAEMYYMEVAAKDLAELAKGLSTDPGRQQDNTLEAICVLASDLAEELLEAIGAVRQDVAGSKWKIVSRSLRVVRGERKTKALQDRLSDLRLQISTHLQFQSKKHQGCVQGALNSMEGRLASIETKIDSISSGRHIICVEGTISAAKQISQDASEIKMPTCTLDTSPSKSSLKESPQVLLNVMKETYTTTSEQAIDPGPAQVDARVDQQSIHIRAPNRFRCGETRCACPCHLGRYLKTPLFLRAFLGSLSFRGTCPNHSSNLWELKYWIPEWISNYNVYLLFERNSCGSPSLGLRFPRKVPWGGQDTIIRFSLLGDVPGIRFILESGQGSLHDVDPNHGRTALHYAVLRNQTEACKLLLEAGADRFIEDESAMSATQKAWEHIFTKRGTPAVLDSFRSLFPSGNHDHWHFSPLHCAVLGIGGLTLSQIVDAGANVPVDSTDARQRTALHWAALRGDLGAVKVLLDAKAEVDVVDEFHSTPLTYAVSASVPRIVELLILSGANVNHINGRGDSPLHYAARHKDDMESVKILVRAGAQVDRKNPLGNTPFAGAAIANRTTAGRYLLGEGADRYSMNKYGDTPLRETIYHNCHEFLSMLLEDGTRYNDVNNHGSSLLHATALEGDIKTIQILKTARLSGLDYELKNAKGQTAMDVCSKRRAPEGFEEAFSGLLSTITATPLS